MKIGGGVVYGSSRGAALPTLVLGHGRARLRCCAFSAIPGNTYKDPLGFLEVLALIVGIVEMQTIWLSLRMWRQLSLLSIWVSCWECSRLEVGGSLIAQPLKSFFFFFWAVEQIYWNNRLCMFVHWRWSIFLFLEFPEVDNMLFSCHLVSWISCFM